MLKAALLRQMPESPEMVFLNCCHRGPALRTGSARADAYETSGMATNSWAAYQCCGHPGFVLVPADRERCGKGAELASLAEALVQIRARSRVPTRPVDACCPIPW